MTSKKKYFKKKKKEDGKNKLPNNSRIITDKLINDHTVFLFGILFIISATVLVLFDYYYNFKKQESIFIQRREIVNELNYWNREVIEKPDYRDGYFSLSLIYYRLGDYKNSKENLEKALNIDPNFQKGKELKEILENK